MCSFSSQNIQNVDEELGHSNIFDLTRLSGSGGLRTTQDYNLNDTLLCQLPASWERIIYLRGVRFQREKVGRGFVSN